MQDIGIIIQKEIEPLSEDVQGEVLKFIRFLKNEILSKENEKKNTNIFFEIEQLSESMGISDLSSQHDHYIYGIDKK